MALFGVAGIVVTLVMLIVRSIFKRDGGKKRLWIIGAASLVLFIVGVVTGIWSVPDGYNAGQQVAEVSEPVSLQQEQEQKPEQEIEQPSTPEQSAVTPIEEEQVFQKEEKPKPYQEWLKSTVEAEIGAESNLNLPRVAGIDFENGDESKPVISLVADDNLTINLVRTVMLFDATNVFKAIFADGRAKVVTIVWGRPVTDKYGNTKMKAVMGIEMSRDTANKINWSNFLHSNLPKVADDFYEAPQSEW
ncbi:conserved protein of unknown function [Candidatus Bipolaricaulis anaerobius]|jgi:hypothetical protein|uniref:Uncharacterized protein n=1 Tax=Candidatus Bipolaricaulis anaerobius TaxID=2026885 RepID=A0A2X3K6Z4_9BACT|nr:hypothetical protein [Candidatus Bipolaricaulis anaerobius]SQD92997.1 conserved protein of unknown function [Candidatus Bipolaricaulis anaerobius]